MVKPGLSEWLEWLVELPFVDDTMSIDDIEVPMASSRPHVAACDTSVTVGSYRVILIVLYFCTAMSCKTTDHA